MSTSTVDTSSTAHVHRHTHEHEHEHVPESERDRRTQHYARNTLVLSADFRPVLVVPRARAFTLVFANKARVIEHYAEATVRSVHAEHVVPAVIVLSAPVQYRKTRIKFTRRALYKRDNYQCQYCGEGFAPADLTFDHVIPVSRGGKTSWDNIVACCVRCNRKKANKTPAEAGMMVLNWPSPPDSMSFTEVHDVQHVPDIWRPYLAPPKKRKQAAARAA